MAEASPAPDAPSPGALEPLLDAVLAVAEDVELDGVLHRVVRAGRELVGARYAALGVLDDDGTGMARFLHDGIDAATAAQIGSLPEGRGVLGEVIVHPEPLVLSDLRTHPTSVGFPPHHPPMESFLGVPVVVAGDVFGNLYLTDKPGGFTATDERLVVALAAVAGTAIRNARDVERLAGQAQVDAAVADVATTVLGGASTEEGLEAAARAAASLVARDATTIDIVAGPPGVAGELATAEGGVRLRVAADGPSLALPDVDPRTHDDLRAFGRRVGIALGYAQARDQVEQLAVRLDRERIARDLHDTVIQRLFGAGLQLDGLTRRLADSDAETVEVVIGELDAAIADLRGTIAALHDPGPLPLLDRLHAVVAALQPITAGLRPLEATGDLQQVPAKVGRDLVAVLREGITNATRHAAATQIRPATTVEDGRVLLVVTDDGVGPGSGATRPADSGGLGLGNLAARAERHGGGCELVAGPSGGAQLRWWAPLPTG